MRHAHTNRQPTFPLGELRPYALLCLHTPAKNLRTVWLSKQCECFYPKSFINAFVLLSPCRFKDEQIDHYGVHPDRVSWRVWPRFDYHSHSCSADSSFEQNRQQLKSSKSPLGGNIYIQDWDVSKAHTWTCNMICILYTMFVGISSETRLEEKARWRHEFNCEAFQNQTHSMDIYIDSGGLDNAI